MQQLKIIFIGTLLSIVSTYALADSNAGQSAALAATSSNDLQKATPASTAPDDDYYNFYVNGGLGGFGATDAGAGFGGMLNFGYNFNRNFAIEAGYTGLSSVLSTAATLGAAPVINYNVLDVAFRANLHLSNYFSIYGKVGPAINMATNTNDGWFGNNVSTSTNAFGALFGEGLSVDLGHVNIFSEFDQFATIAGGTSSIPTSYYGVTLGVQFNF